jgi:hypothetical protein
MTDQQQREVIEDENTIGFKLLGYTVVFSLKGLEVDTATMEDLLSPLNRTDSEGKVKEAKDLLPEVRVHTRLKRAILRWMRDQATDHKESLGIEDKDEKGMLRAITSGSSADILCYAIVSEKRDLDQWGLSYLTNVRVFYNQPGDNIIVNKGKGQDMTYDQDLQNSFLPFWDRYRDVYVAEDIGRLVPRVIATLQSATLKDGGGTYFVPYEQRDALQTLKDIVELHIPTAPNQERAVNLTAIPVIDRPSTKKNMAALAFKAMEAEIITMQKDLERFIEEVKTPVKDRKTGEIKKDKDGNIKYTKVREDTMKDRIKAYGQTKAKVQIFKERLGLQEADLLAKLADLETTARTVITTAADVMSSGSDDESEQPAQETAQPF